MNINNSIKSNLTFDYLRLARDIKVLNFFISSRSSVGNLSGKIFVSHKI